MTLELFGPVASGKTTLSKLLVEEGFVRIRVKNILELLFLNIIFFFKYPLFTITTKFLILKETRGVRGLYYKYMNTFLHHNACFIKSARYEKAILDEGFLQNILSIYERPASKEELTRYIHHIPKKDVIFISVAADKKTILVRSEKRGYLAREHLLSKNQQMKWLEIVLQNNETLGSALRDARIPIIKINGNLSEENFREEARILLERANIIRPKTLKK